jgi:hypothetical protein
MLRRVAALIGPLLLAGCAVGLDAPRLAYQGPRQLSFEAWLYQDMALLEGLRGQVTLERIADSPDDAPRYADATVQAEFGLGVERRLVRLVYTGIPEPVTCERVAAAGSDAAPVRAASRPGPRPPQPPAPDVPVRTNIRMGDGRNGPG